MTTISTNQHLFQVLEEDREGEDFHSYESSKRPSTGLESIKSTSSAFSNQTWRINSTAGEFFDEQFTDTPNLMQGPLLLSNHPSTIQTQNLKDLDSSAITQSISANSNVSSGTQTTHKTENSSMTSTDFTTMSFPSPPNTTNADSPLVPMMSDFPVTNVKVKSPEQSIERQQRLAELRARQHALYLEQQALEMEKTPKQHYEAQFRNSPPLDTDMQDGMNLTVRNTSLTHSPARSSRKRLAPLPPQQALPPVPIPVAPLRLGKSNSTETQKSPYQHENQHRSREDIASDFEMASLRAQVAQLQLALKKQMNPLPQQIAGNKRGEPMDLYELSGLPLTPAESHSGSSERALSRAPSRLRLAAQHSSGQHLMNSEFNSSILDDFGRRMPESSLSPTQRDHFIGQQQRSLNSGNSIRSFNSATQRYPSSSLHRHESLQQSRDTFGNSFAMSTGSGNSGTHSSRYGTNEPSIFSHRTMIPDETASSFSRPSTSDDRRVDELSAKIDRLEELLRLSALQPQSKPMHDEYSTALGQAQAMMQDGSHDAELMRDSRYMQPHQHEISKQERFVSQDEMERNRLVESEVLNVYPRMQKQATYARTPSLASSTTSQGDLSTRTRSPASSAFQFNATPYSRGEQNMINQKEISAPSVHSGTSMDSQGNDEKMGTKTDTHIEHIRRKGVARFILGSATTKLLDSHGESVPSSQVSLSRNRTERIEKPKVKVKSAGRGRIVVKQSTKTA